MKKLLFTCLVFSCISSYGQRISYVDSLKRKILSDNEDTIKLYDYVNLAGEYSYAIMDSCILYSNLALSLAEKLNNIEGEINFLGLIANSYALERNDSLALAIGFKALNLALQHPAPMNLITAYRCMALIYTTSDEFQAGLNYYFKEQAIEQNKANVRYNAYWTYGFQFTTYILIGQAYYELNKLDSALYFTRLGEHLYVENKLEWNFIYNLLGNIYRKKGTYKLAMDNLRIGLSMAQNIDHIQIDIAKGYLGLAQVFYSTGQSDSCILYAKKVIEVAERFSFPDQKLAASILLKNVYTSAHAIDSAFKYQTVVLALKDSLYNQEKARAVQRFAFDEQLHQQELQQQLQQSVLQYKNRLNIYFLIGGLLILLIIAGGLWRKNVYKQKSFALLQKQKQEIDIQKAKVEKALDELKSTQSQLIQSEKMASLGELTAGIAHEIQNPLNFVNNFSEVNKEMLGELKAERLKPKAERDEQTQDEIINDVIENEEKINHHGKRADAIVKNMLQHSKQTKGIKEPTDINALCDEYLRLSYHGMRAKDKNFNSDFKTDFDDTIGKINIVPQDVGRVLLNLFNNAFYAVNEKKKTADENYKSLVSVQTKKLNDKIEIRVEDNGNGIPPKIIDKIFQPFFTTKPTGEGTGLGLSLAYDIIKAHGGEIKVESKEGEGSVFIIQLPLTKTS